MNFDIKTNRIIIEYVLGYNRKSRKTQKPVPKNMWKEIATKINQILEGKQHEPSTSKPLDANDLYCHFERVLIFQLKSDEFGLTEEDFFTIAYPYADILRKLQIVFISNRDAVFNIDEEPLNKLNQILQYRLNRYTFSFDIWDVFDCFYKMGVRNLEINVENSLFGLNPEEKKCLLLQSKRERKRERAKSRKVSQTWSLSSINDTELINLDTQQLQERQLEASLPNTEPNTLTDTLPKTLQLSQPFEMNVDEFQLFPEQDLSSIGFEVPASNGETRLPTESLPAAKSNFENLAAIEIRSKPQTDVPIIESHPVTKTVAVSVHRNLIEPGLNSLPSVPSVSYEMTLIANDSIHHTSEDGEIHLHHKDGSTSNSPPELSDALQPSKASQPTDAPPVDTNHHSFYISPNESDKNQQSSSDVNTNSEGNFISQRQVKNNTLKPLVHWSILFDLYESDVYNE